MTLIYDSMTMNFLIRQKVDVWKLYAALPWPLVQQWCSDMTHPAAIVADLKRLKHFVDEHGLEAAASVGAELQGLEFTEGEILVAGNRTPFGGYWCACLAGVVSKPGKICVACSSGWTEPQYRAKPVQP